jgi:hypothetical protein
MISKVAGLGLLALYYLVGWGYPAYVIYDNHAQYIEAHTGGAFLYTVGFFFFTIAFVKFSSKVKRMKAGYPKLIVGTLLTLVIIYGGRGFIDYINFNFATLYDTLTQILVAQAIAFGVGFTALQLNLEQIREWELM